MNRREQEEIKRYLCLNGKTKGRMRRVASAVGQASGRVTEEFYSHLLSFKGAQAFINDEETLQRIKKLQKEYWRSFFRGSIDPPYFESRLKVGKSHHRTMVPPKWYLGGYAHFLSSFLKILLEKRRVPPKTIQEADALLRYLFLDLVLVYTNLFFLMIEKARACEEQVSLKKKMLKMVGHDMSSSLGALEMMIGMVLQSELPLPRGELTRDMQDVTFHLKRLVDNLLYCARIEENELSLELQSFLLADIVEACLHSYQRRFPQCRLRSEGEFPVVVADSLRVRQILDNLVDNAVKYSSEKGEVVIRGGRKGEKTLVEVQDHGPGMDPKECKVIFSPFTRLGREKVPGTGLGLHIVDELTKLHGEKVWVESQKGVGTSVFFTLPVPPSAKGKKQRINGKV